VGPYGRGEVCSDVSILQACKDQKSTREPGVRWIKTPAAMTPRWREQPERIAAVATPPVDGLRVSTLRQRQVRLSLYDQYPQLPHNKGLITTPTAAIILALCTPVMLVRLRIDTTTGHPIDGVQPQHLLVCDARGMDHVCSEVPGNQGKSAWTSYPRARRHHDLSS